MHQPGLLPDTVIHERYRVVRSIGRGGMGAVYEAIDLRLGHHVALKQTLVEGAAAERAFEREAKLLAGLRHHGLPIVTDFFEDEHGRFLVMQFIPGQSFAELMEARGQAFPAAQVLAWAEALLQILEYLHERQPPILHRDIKPANLKLTDAGEIVLLDFGLAKGSGETVSVGPSVYGLTPQFAPLEQFQGLGTEATSDVFALGATLFFLLTNRPPVDALARASVMSTGKPDPQSAADSVNPAVPKAVGAWLQQAMALHKADRFQGAAAMRRAMPALNASGTADQPTVPWRLPVTDAAPGPPAAHQASASPAGSGPGPASTPPRRTGWWLAVAAAVVLAIALIGLGRLRSTGASGALSSSSAAGAAAEVGYEAVADGGARLTFRWPANDYWVVTKDGKSVGTGSGSSSLDLAPGAYRIAPNSERVFEPIDVTIERGKNAIVTPATGSVEFQWPANDYWVIARGDTHVATELGSRRRVLAVGRYRIAPNSDRVFEPIDVAIEPGKNAVVAPATGSVEVQWPADDYWVIARGDTHVATEHGSRRRVLAVGRYRIAPNSDRVFEPIDVAIEPGKNAVVAPAAGSVEFQWPADDYWAIARGDTHVATEHGSRRRVLAVGDYRIAPNSDRVFEPVPFTITDGSALVLKPPSGTLTVEWSGPDYWVISRGETRVATEQGSRSRVVMPGRYQVAPNSGHPFAPVTVTVEAGRTTVVRPRP